MADHVSDLDVDSSKLKKVLLSKRKFGLLMSFFFRRPEILCIVIAFLFTLFAKYSPSLQDNDQFRDQPPPLPFFLPSSPVVDYPYGHLEEVGQMLEKTELVFVMYYAPWCAVCRRTRSQFEAAANYFNGELQFVGINCWHPNGACRNSNKLLGFPELFLYHTTLNGFKYNGPLLADHMIDFVSNMIYPLRRMLNSKQVSSFMSEKDNGVFGYFDFNSSPQPPGYLQFYYSSMRFIEKDPANYLNFALVTSKHLADSLHMSTAPSIVLSQKFNVTQNYPSSLEYKSSQITKWLSERIMQPSLQWLSAPRGRSISLDRQVSSHPTLIMFTPHYPLQQVNTPYEQLRVVSDSYRSCGNTTIITPAAPAVQTPRPKDCSFLSDITGTKPRPRSNFFIKCCYSLPSSILRRAPQTVTEARRGCHAPYTCQLCYTFDVTHPELTHVDCYGNPPRDHHAYAHSFPPSRSDPVTEYSGHCDSQRLDYNPHERLSVCCRSARTVSMVTDPATGAERRAADMRTRCLRQSYAARQQWLPRRHGNTVRLHEGEDVRGFGCRGNRSLGFVAMDPREHTALVERLGLQVKDELSADPSRDTVVIINKKEESFHIMKNVFNSTIKNLVSFIKDFHSSRLDRRRRSAVSTQPHPSTPRPHPTSLSHEYQPVSHLVHDLTADTFHNTVMATDKDVVVYHYTSWCGQCKAFHAIYLSLAQYFNSSHSIIFCRINVGLNDLPWHLSVESYPTIQFFPSLRKSDSVTFPAHVPRRLPDLVRFVLRHCSASLKLQTALASCAGNACRHRNRKRAETRARLLHQHALRLQTLITQSSQQPSPSNGVASSSLSNQTLQQLSSRLIAVQRLQRDAASLATALRGDALQLSLLRDMLRRHDRSAGDTRRRQGDRETRRVLPEVDTVWLWRQQRSVMSDTDQLGPDVFLDEPNGP